jgi:hypothetical protein
VRVLVAWVIKTSFNTFYGVMRAASLYKNRRVGSDKLYLRLLVCLALSVYLVTVESTTTTDDPPPNFIVFFVDDLGYGDLGFTGE